MYEDQRQHLSAVSAISHNFQFSTQFRTILYYPHNSAYFWFHRIFSHIFPKIALDRIKTKIFVVASWFKNGTFSSLKLGHFGFHVLNGIWDVFVPCQLESGPFSYLADRNVGRFRPCWSESGTFSSLRLTSLTRNVGHFGTCCSESGTFSSWTWDVFVTLDVFVSSWSLANTHHLPMLIVIANTCC